MELAARLLLPSTVRPEPEVVISKPAAPLPEAPVPETEPVEKARRIGCSTWHTVRPWRHRFAPLGRETDSFERLLRNRCRALHLGCHP